VGVDVVDAAGLALRLEQQPGLAEVLFTPGERAASAVPGRALAACFAAKEAFVKALGRGLSAAGPDGWLQEVEVEVDGGGLPRLLLGAAPGRALRRRGFGAPRLALAQAGGFALATVLLFPDAQGVPGGGPLTPPGSVASDGRTRCP
jgi:holo-[acyl-carrier protein] synthase